MLYACRIGCSLGAPVARRRECAVAVGRTEKHSAGPASPAERQHVGKRWWLGARQVPDITGPALARSPEQVGCPFAATTGVGQPVQLSPCSARGLGCPDRLLVFLRACFTALKSCAAAKKSIFWGISQVFWGPLVQLSWLYFELGEAAGTLEALLVGWCPAPDLEKHRWAQKPFRCRGPAPVARAGRRSPGLIPVFCKFSGKARAFYFPK